VSTCPHLYGILGLPTEGEKQGKKIKATTRTTQAANLRGSVDPVAIDTNSPNKSLEVSTSSVTVAPTPRVVTDESPRRILDSVEGRAALEKKGGLVP
jgi:hypothetical protein